jgi:hypothetical protein
MQNRQMTSRISRLPLPLLALAGFLSGFPSFGATDLDEVVVSADRNQLQQMREEMLELEDEFYTRFNELNTDRAFEFNCSDTARTGTNFRRKVCRPRFANEAMGDEGRAWMDGIRGPGTQNGSAIAPARQVIDIKNRQLMLKMVEMVRKDPDLQETLIRYGDLKKKYSAALKGKAP